MAGRGAKMVKLLKELSSQEPKVGSASRATEVAKESPTEPKDDDESKATEVAKESTTDAAAILEDWNPMVEDFEDPEFNSYDRGPGKDLPLHAQRPVKSDKKEDFQCQLYVTGIPIEMDENGLTNLFSRAGEVVRVKKLRSKIDNRKDTYGFVTFRTMSAVEAALRMLNDFPVGDCLMRVRVALSPKEQAARRKAMERKVRMIDEDGDPEEEEEEQVVPEETEDSSSSDLKKTTEQSESGTETKNTEDETDKQAVKQTHEDEKDIIDDQEKGKVQEKVEEEKGKEQEKEKEQKKEKVDEDKKEKENEIEKKKAVVAPAVKMSPSPPPQKTETIPAQAPKIKSPPKQKEPVQSGPCQLCGKEATKRCQKCRRHYCGASCQKADWPKHKYICQTPVSDFEMQFVIDNDDVDDMIEKAVDEEYIIVPFSCAGQERLPVDTLCEIMLTNTESPNRVWVTKAEKEQLKQDIQKQLGSTPRMKVGAHTPSEGELCAALYMDEWYRAVIQSVMPGEQQALVLYVDYGNSQMVNYTDIGRLHQDLVDIPAQAILCDLSIQPVGGGTTWPMPSVEAFVNILRSQDTFMANVEGEDANVEGQACQGVTYTSLYLKDGRHITELMIHNQYAEAEERRSTFKPNLKKRSIDNKKKKEEPGPVDTQTSAPLPPDRAKMKSPVPAVPAETPPKPSPPKPTSAIPAHVMRNIPELRILPSQVPYVVSPKAEVKQVLEVTLMRVESMDEFWIQILDRDIINSFRTLYKDMQADCKAKKKKSIFKAPKNNIIAAYDQKTKSWHRAQIVEYDVKGVFVYYFDRGMTDVVEHTDCQSLESAYFTVPAQALRCCLFDISPVGGQWSEAAVDCFVNYVRPRELCLLAKVVGCEGEIYTIDLDNQTGEGSLRDTLLEKNFAVPGRKVRPNPQLIAETPAPVMKDPSQTIVMAGDIRKCDLPISSDLHDVIIRDSSSHSDLLICETKSVEEFDNYLDEIDSLLSAYKDSYKPVMVSELVFVRDAQNHWWRSEVVAINMDKSAMVRSLDTRKVSTVKRDCMACVPAELPQAPVISIQCALHGIEAMAEGISWKDDIVPLFQGKTLKAQVRGKNGALHSIELYSEVEDGLKNLNKSLVKEGFLMSVNAGTTPRQKPVIPTSTKIPSPVQLAMPGSTPPPQVTSPPRPTMITPPGKLTTTATIAPIHYTDRMVKVTQPDTLVTIWEASNPGHFYCQLQDNVKMFQNFQDEFQDAYTNKKRNMVAGRGMIVAALNSDDNRWYRAQVLNASHPTTGRVAVRYVDFGHVDLLDPESLQQIEKQHLELDFQGIRCHLKGWDKIKKDVEILAGHFKENFQEQTVRLRVGEMREGSYSVEDVVEGGKSAFSAGGVLTVLAELGVCPNAGKTPPKSADRDDKSFVGLVSSFTTFMDFGIQREDAQEKIVTLQEDVDIHCQQTPSSADFDPDTGTVCCAQFTDDGLWYRAFVVAKTSSCYMVRFLDYGNIQSVPRAHLRPITDDLAAIEPFVLKCALSGIVQPDGGLSAADDTRFGEAILNERIQVTLVKIIEGVHWVKLTHPKLGDLSQAVTNRAL